MSRFAWLLCAWSLSAVALGGPTYIPGDFDVNGMVGFVDVAAYVDCAAGPAVNVAGFCTEGDANDDGDVNIADAISLLGHLFGGAPPLEEPFDTCGSDHTADAVHGYRIRPTATRGLVVR